MARRTRGKNEGTIGRRRDGRWQARIEAGYRDGKRKRLAVYSTTRAEVAAKLAGLQVNRDNGLPVIIERQTVKQFVTVWLEGVLKSRAKPRAYESFCTIAKNHIYPSLGTIPLKKLTPQHVQALLDEKAKPPKNPAPAVGPFGHEAKPKARKVRGHGLSPQTIVNVRTVLRSALAQALKWGLVARNVAALVDAPTIPRRQVTPLDPENARSLLDAARGTRFEAIYVVALNLGLRRGEVLGLRWSDVDLDKRELRVNQSIQRIRTGSDEKGKKTELLAGATKTDGSRRTIALPDSVVRALRLRRAHQAEQRLAAGNRWVDQDLIFTNGVGRAVEPIVLHRDFKTLLEKAKLPTTLRLHDLRHSAASLLLAQGTSPRAIMELLGHSSIAVTMNIYAHVFPAMMREAADTMEGILGSKA